MESEATTNMRVKRQGAVATVILDRSTVCLPRLIGLSRALDLILTGRPVPAEEALALGLVNRVVPHGQARQAAES